MERITRTDLDRISGLVSQLLPKGTYVCPVESSGRCRLDLCHMVRETETSSRVEVSRALRAGTKREMYSTCSRCARASCSPAGDEVGA
jgi:hypothetical protein